MKKLGRSIQYKAGDYVGKAKILMLTDSWLPYEDAPPHTRKSIFKCHCCDIEYEASIDYIRKHGENLVKRCRSTVATKNEYNVGDKVGINSIEILQILPTTKSQEGKYQDRKYIFKCKDCERPFTSYIGEIHKGRTSCGCSNQKRLIYNGDILNGFEVIEANVEVNSSNNRMSIFKCKHCGSNFKARNSSIRNGLISSCGCTKIPSKDESKLYDFISSQYPTYNIRRSPRLLGLKEIDIFIEDLNIGFEFNGLYWHSEDKGRDEFYHLNKTLLAKEKNIDLIHIFEHQWKFKEDLVKDYILKYLNLQSSEIDLSLCNIQEVSKEDSLTFHTNNNLYDAQISDINLGLHFMNECVALISINKFESHYEITTLSMKRDFYNKDVYKYLLNHFETNYPKKDIHCKSDIALPIKDILEYLGFSFYKREFPKSYYFNCSNLEILNKEQIKDILQNSTIEDDEYQAITEEGYLRYWDCGKDTYIKQKGNL